MSTRIIRIATRKSALALWQAEYVKAALLNAHKNLQVELVPMSTQGDKILDTPLAKIGGKGLFIKELEVAMTEGRADIAVHSMKDVPVAFPEGFGLHAICERENPFDAFVSNHFKSLEELPQNAVVGTSSLRRQCQLRKVRPDLVIKDLRGNVNTRLAKLDAGEYDAIVLAQAGISRLGVDVNFTPLSVDDFSPSPGQGAIAIVARTDDVQTIDMLKKIEDTDSRLEIEAERALSDYIDSGCRFPLGAYAKSDGDEMNLTVYAFSVDGKQSLQVTKSGDKNNPKLLGKQVGEELRSKGINDLALNWRQKVEEWNTT